MGRIALREAQVGMVLAADVRGRMGRLLMTRGRALTEQALRVFRMWGVVVIDVEGHGAEASDAAPAPDPTNGDARDVAPRIDALFRHADRRHPAVAELARLTAFRLARSAGAPRCD